MRTRTIAVSVLLFGGMSYSVADELRMDAEAVLRAEQFLQACGARQPAGKALARRDSELSFEGWTVSFEDDSMRIAIRASDGAIRSYFDSGQDELVAARASGNSRLVRSEADATRIARRCLDAMGLSKVDWTDSSLRRVGDEPGAGNDRNNRADRWIVTFQDRYLGYRGYANQVGVTIDVVEGKVIQAWGDDSFRFEAPGTTMNLEQGIEQLRGAFEAGERWFRSRGANDLARRYQWPGDEFAMQHAGLRLAYGGDRAVRGDDFGPRMLARRAVRAAWCLSSHGVEICVDAENGKIVAEYVTKTEPPERLVDAANPGSELPQQGESGPRSPAVHWLAISVAAAMAAVWLAVRFSRR